MKTIVLVLTVGLFAPLAANGERALTIRDKTLVAWVGLADLSQRGGSALTLIDDQERFDAIVLGERAPGKWMAGSDFFRRTPDDQSAYPQEAADGTTTVKVAIVYAGDIITIYRDTKQYARYAIDKPQSFNDDATVLIGLRYVGHMGEIGFLAGAIEEARVYDTALDAETIAALKPNSDSIPKPIAQWTFEDGTAVDAMGTFTKSTLHGATRIAGGKLHLDGKTAYLECFRPRKLAVEGMFFRPHSRDTGRMWDTWLFFRDGTYYLYYLANAGARWDNISMATSTNGVYWHERGRILSKAEGVTWMGTGSTWKSPHFENDGKFFMNFSEWRGPRQTIFFAESTDLLHWTRLGDEYEFKQDTRWYEPNGRWDCIWTIPRPGGGLYGYWTATPKPETGGRFGFGETIDGARWTALPPPKVHGVGGGEVGAIEKIGDKYFMMFGTKGMMVTLVAERPEGPFHAAEKNFKFLSGHTYFARFFPSADGVLVNHHSIARDRWVYFSPLKSTVIDDDGTFRLGWWKANEALKGDPVPVQLATNEESKTGTIAMLGNTFDVDTGMIMEGNVTLPATGQIPSVGLYVECGKGQGAAVLIDGKGVAHLGKMNGDGTGFVVEKQIDREMQFGRAARFRLLLKHSLLEFYLNDILIECFSLPDAATGRIGLIHGGGKKTIKDMKAWRQTRTKANGTDVVF
ncbi:MAG: hypothetical protein ISR77_03710 [Pirellulaceae bacterium]|nr:hypothetical protein [Pirellulaceae bacterium]